MLERVLMGAFVALFVAVIGGLLFLGQYACHRYIGPWMTGGDPVAVATYCRPAK